MWGWIKGHLLARLVQFLWIRVHINMGHASILHNHSHCLFISCMWLFLVLLRASSLASRRPQQQVYITLPVSSQYMQPESSHRVAVQPFPTVQASGLKAGEIRNRLSGKSGSQIPFAVPTHMALFFIFVSAPQWKREKREGVLRNGSWESDTQAKQKGRESMRVEKGNDWKAKWEEISHFREIERKGLRGCEMHEESFICFFGGIESLQKCVYQPLLCPLVTLGWSCWRNQIGS